MASVFNFRCSGNSNEAPPQTDEACYNDPHNGETDLRGPHPVSVPFTVPVHRCNEPGPLLPSGKSENSGESQAIGQDYGTVAIQPA